MFQPPHGMARQHDEILMDAMPILLRTATIYLRVNLNLKQRRLLSSMTSAWFVYTLTAHGVIGCTCSYQCLSATGPWVGQY